MNQNHQLCIEACLACASTCNFCASSCTREENVKMMAKCIRLDMECAAICYATAQLLSLGSDKAKAIPGCALKSVLSAPKSAVNTITTTARNAPKLAESVPKNAVKFMSDK